MAEEFGFPFVCDFGVSLAVTGAKIELIHVRRARDEVVETERGRFALRIPEAVDDFGGAHRVEIQLRDAVAESGRAKSVVAFEEAVPFEIIEYPLGDGFESARLVGLGRVQRPFEEVEEFLLRARESGRDGGEDVGSERGFGREFRVNGFRVGPDVLVEQFL